nr:restriction endonuclease subunit S [Conchiformibius kuhniae]
MEGVGRGCSITKRKIITAKSASVGNIPVISGGQKPAYFTGEYNRDGETITIAGSGAYAGFVMYWNEPIFVGDAFSVKPNENLLLTKYVYYFLLSNQTKIFGMKKGSGVPHVYPKDVANLIIPIPSLSLQKEIVKILDKMTELEATLEAELALRAKQYQYYRDLLLDCENPQNPFSGSLKVEWKTLDKIAKNFNSMRKPIRSGLREKGNIPYYGASGVVDYIKDYIFDGDFLLISEDGANLLARNTPIAFSISGKSWVNNHAHVLQFNSYAERRFIESYLNNIDLTPYISGAAQPKLNKQNLNSIKIPVPPPEIQAKIVEILDKFDTLTHSLTEGLPREIALRRKQYEYYRAQLLNFQVT